MNLHNLQTAVSDERLYGHSLIQPWRWSKAAFQNATAPCSTLRVQECCLRVFAALGAMTAIVTLPLAAVAIVCKWIDLARRMDTLVHNSSAIADTIPLILKPFSRTGDRTVSRMNAEYWGWKANLPVLHQDFFGADFFQFSTSGLKGLLYFKQIVTLKAPEDVETMIAADHAKSILYQVPFYPYSRDLSRESTSCSYPKFTTDWIEFQPRARQLLQTVGALYQYPFPKDSYYIAIHWRDGGNFDDERTKSIHPLKLPTAEFYINELRRLLQSDAIAPDKRIHIHVFTDALNPEAVCAQVASVTNECDRDITIGFRRKATLKDDIANMGRFSAMIRSDSNLSGPLCGVSSVMQYEAFPSAARVDDDKCMIEISEVTVRRGREDVKLETHYQKPLRTAGMPRFVRNWFWRYFGVEVRT